jgi:hypothetical protein
MMETTDEGSNEKATLAETEAGFEKVGRDPKALAAHRAASQEIGKLVDRYSGCLDTGGDLNVRVDGLREEWR